MLFALITSLLLHSLVNLFSASNLIVDHSHEFLSSDCFVLSESKIQTQSDEVVLCYFAQAGYFPSQTQRLRLGRCCFRAHEGHAVFWAIGESSISAQINLLIPKNENPGTLRTSAKRLHSFALEAAVLAEFLILDATTDEGVAQARVTMADQSLHLLAYTKVSDDDGFIVLPMQVGQNYVLNVRAQGYLNASPIAMTPTSPGEDELVAQVIELDPGLTLSGRVLDARRQPIAGAKIHVLVRQGDSLWDNEVDQAKPISSFANADRGIWFPRRSASTTDDQGRFLINTLPRGKLSLYAYDARRGPSTLVQVDASEVNALEGLELSLSEGVNVLLRLNSSVESPIVLSVQDKNSMHMFAPIRGKTNSNLRLLNMPPNARFTIEGEGILTMTSDQKLSDGQELSIDLALPKDGRVRGQVIDGQTGKGIVKATLSAVTSELSQCRSKTDQTGAFVIETCPSTGYWALASAPGYAPHVFWLSSQSPQKLELNQGAGVEIVIDQPWPEAAKAQCSFSTIYQNANGETWVFEEAFGLERGRSQIDLRPALPQRLNCKIDGYEDLNANISPQLGEKLKLELKLRALETIEGVVLDAQAAPVPQALIVIGGQKIEADLYGNFSHTKPSAQAQEGTAYHWLHGQGRFKLGGTKQASGRYEIRLTEDIPEKCLTRLYTLGIDYLHEGHSLQIEGIPKATGTQTTGLKRGDYVEDCSNNSWQVVRDNRRLFLSSP